MFIFTDKPNIRALPVDSGVQAFVPVDTGSALKRSRRMKNYRKVLNGLMQDESGQDLIEYALVAALIGLAAVTGMNGVATSIISAFTSIATSLNSAV
jgi:pilus assembly protein Flp/PilA